MQIYNPHTGQHETPTHFRSCAAFTIDPIPLAEVLKDHPEAEYSPVYSTGETSEVHYTVSAISMLLNPSTGKQDPPTHYLAYEAETTSWSAPIAARHAAELPADTVLTPVLTGRGYGEPTTAGALAAWLNKRTKFPTTPHTENTRYHIYDTATDTWSKHAYPLDEIMSQPDTSASTSLRPLDSEQIITLAQARKMTKEQPAEEPARPTSRIHQSEEKEAQEINRLETLPSEVRAVEYLLQHTELKGAISEAKRLFDKSASFIELALYLNIAAIIILLFVLVITLGK